MTSRFMRSCAAALLALAAANPIAPAIAANPGGTNPGAANRCALEPGSERLYVSPSEAFVRAAGARTMSHQVLSLVTRNIGHFDVELAFEGPFVGETEERQAELMTSIAREFGMTGEPDIDSEPASAR